MSKSKKALGVDYGGRRVGIAVASEGIAFPREVVATIKALDRIAEIAKAEGAEIIVLGLPVHMDGAESDTTHSVRSFSGRLAKALPWVDIIHWDERLSSAEAAFALREADRSHEADDAVAAAIILQNYLDTEKTACI